MSRFCKVAVNSPFNNSILSYQVLSTQDVKIGQVWNVPLGKRRVVGCVLNFIDEIEDFDEDKIKPLDSIYDSKIFFNDKQLSFLNWVSDYYHYPLGMLINDIIPKKMKQPKKLNVFQGKGNNQIQLNNDQNEIYQEIKKKINTFSKHLIHGITGSGKTIIYTSMIKDVVKRGKSALFVLPEINLTTQFIEFLQEYIECPVYCYNSSLSNSDKYGLWVKLLEDNEPKIILSVRSGIFLPVNDLGLIIVDEEHDQSFKQEDRCCYNARDIGIKLAQLNNIPIVLGSATPSVESYYKFNENKYSLDKRYKGFDLPEVEIFEENNKKVDQEEWPFLPETLVEIEKKLQEGEQVVILLNRLGYSNYIQCRACGHQFNCLNCTVPLRYFKKKNKLSCQTCEFEAPIPVECPVCGNMSLLNKGYGTEKLKEILDNKFPNFKTERLDRDEISTFNKLNKRLEEFHSHEIDILVGTQMLSKGHNFKKVNLVVVLGVDSLLNFPDFRSTERVYQLLTQVAGRAGRFKGGGKVIIQTNSKENKIFSFIKNPDLHSYYEYEMPLRELSHCPPFSRMAMIYITSRFQTKAEADAMSSKNIFDQIKSSFKDVNVLGPRPALIEKRANKFTWCLLLSSSNINELHNIIASYDQNFRPSSGTTFKIDIDPYHIS